MSKFSLQKENLYLCNNERHMITTRVIRNCKRYLQMPDFYVVFNMIKIDIPHKYKGHTTLL